MNEYRRTIIRTLSVHRYRSLAAVELDNLPPIIALYGPNGSGKSNLLRAMQLLLRAAALPPDLPRKDDPATLSLQEADSKLNLRLDDFRFGDLPEIRVFLEIELGTRAAEMVLPPSGRSLSLLRLEGVFRAPGSGLIEYWFEQADVDGELELGAPSEPSNHNVFQQIATTEDALAQAKAQAGAMQEVLENIDEHPNTSAAGVAFQRANQKAQIRTQANNVRALQARLKDLQRSLGEAALVAHRVQRVLIPRLLQISEPYRVPGGLQDPEDALYRALLSEDPHERDAARRMSERVASAGLFGAQAGDVPLIPVTSTTYGERQVRFRHPRHGELPLRNLGTGEQQVVLMLGQRVITPYPIAHIEEPEAHLHWRLMGSLARVLRVSVLGEGGRPDVDQLWMATHHRLFAITSEFFDVRLDEHGATQVERRKRDAAAKHFFEPSPYWDTLRRLVQESGLDPATVVFRNDQGRGVTAQDVLDSLEGDQELAKNFVESATEAFVLSLSEQEPAK